MACAARPLDPDKTALVFGERSWTYAELDAAANCVANALLQEGLEKGDQVVAYGRSSDAYAILWLAYTRAGLIHVPTNFALSVEELLYILNQSGSKALFYDASLTEEVEAVHDRAEAEIPRGVFGSGHGLRGAAHGRLSGRAIGITDGIIRASARESYPTPGVIEPVEPSPIEPGEVYEYVTHLRQKFGWPQIRLYGVESTTYEQRSSQTLFRLPLERLSPHHHHHRPLGHEGRDRKPRREDHSLFGE